VTLADYGGSKQAVELVKNGEVALTVPIYPYDETIDALEGIAAAVDGKEVPRVVQRPFKIVTKDNVESFTPQY
jgi:ABC-type sugar transport system substrate-binding protein